LVEFALEKGFDKLATGHYATIKDGVIGCAKDVFKDQSYFLSNTKKELLRNVLFPLGDMLKSEVKEIANNIDILESIAKQRESSEICFVPTTYLDILQKHYETNKEGDVLDSRGNIVGYHFGYMRYTIGQRKGFRLFKAHTPHYVLKIIPQKNQIIVGTKEELLKKEFYISNLNLFKEFEQDIVPCQVKIRYRSLKADCKLYTKELKVVFNEPQSGITPSQTAAFYDDETIIGSALIKG